MDMHWPKKITSKIKQTNPFFWYWTLPLYIAMFILLIVLLCLK